MSKSKGTFGTPVNHIGPTGAAVGSSQGRTPGVPAGMSGTTTKDQFRGSAIDTRPAPGSGTPYQDRDGNPDETSRTVSQGRYGVSPGAGGVDMNDPKANGTGVVFDGAKSSNGYMPNPGPALDSPVSKAAPYFEGRSVEQENRAHLGQGNQDAARDDLRQIPGGVMGRE